MVARDDFILLSTYFKHRINHDRHIEAQPADTHHRAHVLARVAQHFEHQVGAAVEHFRESLRIQPDQSMIWKEFGTVLLRIGKPQEAVIALRNALQYSPGDYNARYQLAIACLKSGATNEAIQLLERIVLDVPNSAGARFHLALALEQAGRVEEARAQLKEAVRLSPRDPKKAEQLAKEPAL